jgi:hypothetical protein
MSNDIAKGYKGEMSAYIELNLKLEKLEQIIKELEERIDTLEQDVSLKQFCKGAELIGYRLSIGPSTAKGESK